MFASILFFPFIFSYQEVGSECSVVIGMASKDTDNYFTTEHEQELGVSSLSVNTDRPVQPTVDFDIDAGVDFSEPQNSALQKQLVESEMECKALQEQLTQLSHKHKAEIEVAINQRRIQEQLVQEHVSHIARLSAELANAQLHELDEGEAMRIRLMKEQLKEIYEQDKNSLLMEHKREKDQLSKEYLQQQDDCKRSIEQQANNEIQRIHLEYREAYDHVLAEKSALESEANKLKMQCSAMEMNLKKVLHENTSIEEKCQLLTQSHSDEIERNQLAANKAEESILHWKLQAAALEAKVNELERNQLELNRQLDHLKTSLFDTQEELSTNKNQVEEYRFELEELKSKHALDVQQLQEQHQAEKEELETNLTDQLASLENSLTEASGDKASLDVAEVHMKSLEKQLREYRLQEQSFQNKLHQLEQQCRKEVEAVRHQYETEKTEEIQSITTNFTKQIEALEQELSELQKTVHSECNLYIPHADHEKALIELQRNYEESQRAACNELQLAHEKKLETLIHQHKCDIIAINTQMHTDIEIARQDFQKRHVEEKEAEIQSLKQKHSANIQRLRESLLESKDSPLAVSEAQVAKLEAELHEQKTEWQTANQDLMSQLELAQRNCDELKQNLLVCDQGKKQLAEQLTQCEESVRVLKVDLSIAVNSAEEGRYNSESMKQQLAQCKQRLDEMSAAHESKEQKVIQLSQECADKQSIIADLTTQCEALKEEIHQVSQKEHEVSLQLGIIKGECNKFQSDYNAAILLLKTRDTELVQIRTELDASCHLLATSKQVLENQVTELLAEAEKLKLKSSDELEHQKQVYEDRIHHLNSSIVDLQKRFDCIFAENSTLKQEVMFMKESMGSIDKTDLELVSMERDQLLLKIEQLENSQVAFENEKNRCELKILEQEQRIQDLLMQLNTREVAFTKLQKEYTRHTAPRDNSSIKKPHDLKCNGDNLHGLTSEHVCIEESLSTAREALTTKLQEKADLERNLNFHRTELERRLAEKQRLEELLFEKSRFEQELQSQKDQLQSELHDIELRLRLKEKELDQHHFERKSSTGAKDCGIQKEGVIAMKVNHSVE